MKKYSPGHIYNNIYRTSSNGELQWCCIVPKRVIFNWYEWAVMYIWHVLRESIVRLSMVI